MKKEQNQKHDKFNIDLYIYSGRKERKNRDHIKKKKGRIMDYEKERSKDMEIKT